MTTHRMSATKLYKVWTSMKGRCHNTKDRQYHLYGGRGISVCQRWMGSFENFYADVGPRPSDKHSIDRIDNNGNYEPGNVRWATGRQQLLNRRTSKKYEYQGSVLSCMEISELSGFSYMTISTRLARGMSAHDAINTPLDEKAKRNSHKRFAMSSDDSR